MKTPYPYYIWQYIINEMLDTNTYLLKVQQSNNNLILNIEYNRTKIGIHVDISTDYTIDEYITITVYMLPIIKSKNIIFKKSNHFIHVTTEMIQFLTKKYPSSDDIIDLSESTIDVLIKTLEKELSFTPTQSTYWMYEPLTLHPGCYRLSFSDGTEYIGKSNHLFRRLSEHLRAPYSSEIERVWIYPLSKNQRQNDDLWLFEHELISHYGTFENGRNKNRGVLINPRKFQGDDFQ